MLRIAWRGMKARGLRLLLSIFAVVFGTAFVSSSLALTDSIQAVFDDLFDSAASNTDVVVRAVENDASNGDPIIALGAVDTVSEVPGVASAQPSTGFPAGVVLTSGEPFDGTRTYGTNLPATGGGGGWAVSEGEAPAGAGEFVMDAAVAADAGFAIGDTVGVFTNTQPQDFTLVGLAQFGGQEDAGPAGGALLFSTPEALALSGFPDTVSSIDIVADEGTSPDELAVAVADSGLPAGVEAVTADQVAQDNAASVGETVTFISTFLLAFAAVALLVGSFLIFNTFTMLIAQRVRELALLRAVGAGRRQVIGSVLVESALLGLVGGAIGAGVGLLLAVGLRAAANATGAELPEGPLVVEPRTVIIAILVGLVITTAAALIPALRASRIPPVAALRDAELPAPSGRRSTIVGTVLLVGGGIALVFGLQGNLTLAGLGALGVFVGVAALAPLLARPFLSPIAALFRAVPGRVGSRNATRNPRRTASTAAALMIGVALVCAVSILATSIKASFANVVDDSFAGQLAVFDSSGSPAGLDPSVAQDLAALPEVDRVDPLPFSSVQAAAGGADETISVSGVADGGLGGTLNIEGVDGDVESVGAGQILVDTDTAEALAVTVGGSITLTGQQPDAAPREYTVAGTYEMNILAEGALVPAADATALGLPQNLLLIAGSGSEAALRTAVESVTSAFPTAEVQSRDDILGDASSSIDGLLSFIYLLLALSVLVAFFGIVNTMALSVIERTRELGVLRAVGLSRRQLKRMVRVEALLVGVFGGLLGVALGVVLGIALQRALRDQGFETLSIPWGTLVLALVVSAAAGVLAAVLPAIRASRMNVLAALRTD